MYGSGAVAVSELSLAIDSGECFGLLGPNGAGKSTAISVMTGFLRPTAGRVLAAGLDTSTHMKQARGMLALHVYAALFGINRNKCVNLLP